MRMLKALGRLAGHDLRLYTSLALRLARRTRGTAGGRGFGYMRGQGATGGGWPSCA
ncbi:hypothetical protein [Streptomyces sp. NPDC007205]|uniref:hypothetical protein n=1 Tax=Streptomyces sp. NPDC007205 TaxID=3154316 RepID=UPI0033E8D6FC